MLGHFLASGGGHHKIPARPTSEQITHVCLWRCAKAGAREGCKLVENVCIHVVSVCMFSAVPKIQARTGGGYQIFSEVHVNQHEYGVVYTPNEALFSQRVRIQSDPTGLEKGVTNTANVDKQISHPYKISCNSLKTVAFRGVVHIELPGLEMKDKRENNPVFREACKRDISLCRA